MNLLVKRNTFIAVAVLLLSGCSTTPTVIKPVNLPAWRGGHNEARYRPQALVGALRRVANATHDGRHPIVVFDLDGTLVDNRPRTLQILQELARTADGKRIATAVSTLSVARIYYTVDETLCHAGICDPGIRHNAELFWRNRFFSDRYLMYDRPILGAPQYVRALADAGAAIVYLTGREETTRRGTKENLRQGGFPVDDVHIQLLMRPVEPKRFDMEFKMMAFGNLARDQGPDKFILMTAENEPINVAAMRLEAPSATLLYVDSDHDPINDDTLPPGHTVWVPDFRRPEDKPLEESPN